MKNFISDGNVMDYTVTDLAVTSGSIVVVGDVAGVAVTDGATGDIVSLQTKGVFELTKGTSAITQGQKLYLKADDGTIVSTLTDNKFVGYAWEAATAAAKTVLVRLNA